MLTTLAVWLMFQGQCYGLVPERALSIPGVQLFGDRPSGECLEGNPPSQELVLALYAQRLGFLSPLGVTRVYASSRQPADGVRRVLCAVDTPTGRILRCADVGSEFVVDPALVSVALAVCPQTPQTDLVAYNTSLADYVTMYTDKGHTVWIAPLWALCWRNCWDVNNSLCDLGTARHVRRVVRRIP
jgi:hypothetical protein